MLNGVEIDRVERLRREKRKEPVVFRCLWRIGLMDKMVIRGNRLPSDENQFLATAAGEKDREWNLANALFEESNPLEPVLVVPI